MKILDSFIDYNKFSKILNASALVDLLLAVFASTLFTLSINNDHWGGDLIVQSLISQKHITYYYWEQDRFFNLVPILAWPFHHAFTNLKATALINAFGLCSTILLLCKLSTSSKLENPWIYRCSWCVCLILIAISWSRLELYYFGKDAQPYAWS